MGRPGCYVHVCVGLNDNGFQRKKGSKKRRREKNSRARKKMKKREGERECVKDELDRRNLKMRCHQMKLLIRKNKSSNEVEASIASSRRRRRQTIKQAEKDKINAKDN